MWALQLDEEPLATCSPAFCCARFDTDAAANPFWLCKAMPPRRWVHDMSTLPASPVGGPLGRRGSGSQAEHLVDSRIQCVSLHGLRDIGVNADGEAAFL